MIQAAEGVEREEKTGMRSRWGEEFLEKRERMKIAHEIQILFSEQEEASKDVYANSIPTFLLGWDSMCLDSGVDVNIYMLIFLHGILLSVVNT